MTQNNEKIKEVISQIIHGLEGFLKIPSDLEDQFKDFTMHNILAAIWLDEIIKLIIDIFINPGYNITEVLFDCVGWDKTELESKFVERYKDEKFRENLDLAFQLFDELFSIEGIEYVVPIYSLTTKLDELMKLTEIYFNKKITDIDITSYEDLFELISKIINILSEPNKIDSLKRLIHVKQNLEAKFFITPEESSKLLVKI